MNAKKSPMLAVKKHHCHGPPLALALLGCLLLTSSAMAASYTLQDLNSTANVATNGGISQWIVDGSNNLFSQWFWIRIGNTYEQRIDTIDADGPLVNHTNSDFDPGLESLQLRYEGLNLQIDVSLELLGGTPGSGTSDLLEGISITNTGDASQVLHFFQYVNFDLGGTAGGDTVVAVPPFAMVQTGDGWVSETADTPRPNRYEVGVFPNTLNKLNDDDADNLNNAAGPVGPGDVTWAFQWDFTLAPGGSYLISKDKHLVVPEPLTIAGLFLGIGSLAGYVRRRSAA